MPKKDFSQNALSIVELVTGEKIAKNSAAVSLGRLGGLKGGKARALKLTGEERSAIAKKAALSRWKKKQNEGLDFSKKQKRNISES